MRNPVEIDHIDPRWSEGRDYQLVCGLDIDTNFCERDNRLNIQKSNRFLPWRVAYDEVGSIPVNPGDLCQFLDCETGEWVLEEFMGNWWFEQAKNLCGQSRGGQKTYKEGTGFWSFTKEQRSEVCRKGSKNQSLEDKALGGRNGSKTQIEQGTGIHGLTSKQRSEMAIKHGVSPSREAIVKGAEAVNKLRHMCLITGHISTPCGLSNYQRHRGIDPNSYTRLTPEECAFIYLWGDEIPKEWLKEKARINLTKTGRANLKKVTPKQRQISAQNLNNALWLSLVTGDISTAAGIHNIHKKAGLDRKTSRAKRSKLTPEEAAFSFLWKF